MSSDDDLYRIDDVYLGPRGRSIPWRVRYRAYWIGGGIYLVALFLETVIGVIGILPALYALVATVYVTTKLMQYIDYERPAKAMTKAIWQEITTPRPRPKRIHLARFDDATGRLHRRPFPPTSPCRRTPQPPDAGSGRRLEKKAPARMRRRRHSAPRNRPVD